MQKYDFFLYCKKIFSTTVQQTGSIRALTRQSYTAVASGPGANFFSAPIAIVGYRGDVVGHCSPAFYATISYSSLTLMFTL